MGLADESPLLPGPGRAWGPGRVWLEGGFPGGPAGGLWEQRPGWEADASACSAQAWGLFPPGRAPEEAPAVWKIILLLFLVQPEAEPALRFPALGAVVVRIPSSLLFGDLLDLSKSHHKSPNLLRASAWLWWGSDLEERFGAAAPG